jgi:hypothetical protein
MKKTVVSLGLLASAFSPLTTTLALLISPFPTMWMNVTLAVLLGLPLLLVPLTLLAASKLADERIRSSKVRKKDVEILSFISSFILPITVAIFAPEDARTAATLVVLILLSIVYVRGGLQYLNPVLTLLGYHLYLVEQHNGAEVYVLTRQNFLMQQASIDAKRLATNIYIQMGK